MCVAFFFSFPHWARSPASFTFYGIVSEEKILICIYVHVHATLFFWHALNIQHHTGVKSINCLRLHASGYGIVYSMEMIVLGWMCIFKYYKSTSSRPWGKFLKPYSWATLKIVSLHTQTYSMKFYFCICSCKPELHLIWNWNHAISASRKQRNLNLCQSVWWYT